MYIGVSFVMGFDLRLKVCLRHNNCTRMFVCVSKALSSTMLLLEAEKIYFTKRDRFESVYMSVERWRTFLIIHYLVRS